MTLEQELNIKKEIARLEKQSIDLFEGKNYVVHAYFLHSHIIFTLNISPFNHLINVLKNN